jgi:ABC-type multidrug transport system fused ATPase/permease subunit
MILNVLEKIVNHSQDLAESAVVSGTVQTDVNSQFSAIESRDFFTMSRCFCQEENNVQQIRMAYDAGIRIHHKCLAVDTIFGQLVQILRDSGTFAALWLGGLQVLSGSLSAGDLTSFMVQSESLVETAEGLYGSFRSVQEGYLPGIRELARFMAMQPKIGLTSVPGGPKYITPTAEEEPDLSWSIEFKDCTFAYPCNKFKPILTDFSLRIDSGTVVGICGQTHCGKSTVLRMIERLYDVDSGEIFIGDKSITTLDPTWLRQHIGFAMSVKDTKVLGNKSVLQNIQVGASMKGLSGEEVRQRAVKAAGIARMQHEVEDEKIFPKKWHTTVGDQGDINLSDGQTQRLSIARALVGEPSLLLMDEPTSALDGPTEKQVLDGIQKYVREHGTHRTAVIVAHRMCTFAICDQVIFMKEGSVYGAWIVLAFILFALEGCYWIQPQLA